MCHGRKIQNSKNSEPQPSSSDSHVAMGSVETRQQTKQDDPMDTEEKSHSKLETVVTPVQNEQDKCNVSPQDAENKSSECTSSESVPVITEQPNEILKSSNIPPQTEIKDVEMKSEVVPNVLVIPEIKVKNAEMTEQNLTESENSDVSSKEENASQNEIKPKSSKEPLQAINEDSCSSTISKEDIVEPIKVASEVSTSSEESSSSSDNTDGNSNSPKPGPESQTDIPAESIKGGSITDEDTKTEEACNETSTVNETVDNTPQITIQTDNYSISDVNSEIKEISPEKISKSEEISNETGDEKTEEKPVEKLELETEVKATPVP
ncbi:unnamed protein product, partial [Iphiclides podalirius]